MCSFTLAYCKKIVYVDQCEETLNGISFNETLKDNTLFIEEINWLSQFVIVRN